LKYKDKIGYITLHGLGEPLLDRGLPEKVKIAKDMGFKGTGFASNCTHLTENISLELLDAGLDSIICSIDGINKETHEAIRVGTDFDQIVSNVQRFIGLRNKFGKTRVLVRFIRQEKNRHEFDAFKAYWKAKLDSELGDDVLVFDVHNWGEKLDNYAQ
jgi:MoaA/NifB/PqqE/SkfB family radical SAM enzyme